MQFGKSGWSSGVKLSIAVGLVLFAGGGAQAAPPQSCTLDLDAPGVWYGPFGPFLAMGASGPKLPCAEIAHAVLLPPPATVAGDPTHADYARVLFMCRSNGGNVQGDAEHPGSGNRSFLWKPNFRPVEVTELDGPLFGYIGTHDPFCSGHAVAADGAVLVAGGLNYVAKCWSTDPCIQGPSGPDSNTPVGHNVVYRLDTSVSPPTWTADATWPAFLSREHWYPTATLLHDGTLFVAGHEGAPSPDCQVPYWPYGSESTDRTFERFDPATGLSSLDFNRRYDPLNPDCVGGPLFSVADYPRLHLLSDGRLLFGNSRQQGGAPWSRLMDIQAPPCVQGLRWEDPVSGPSAQRDGGSSVHLVRRTGQEPGDVQDIVIALAGASEGDDGACDGGVLGTSITLHDSAERFDAASDTWVPLATMLRKRVNQNAVILPTGSIFVPGGVGLVGDVGLVCEPVMEAEEFFPAEIFGGSPQGVWRPRAAMSRPRGYHSVALLLPDGRVMVAGGSAQTWMWGGHPDAVYHTAEIFTPAYYFRSGRPVVTNWPNPVTPIDYSPAGVQTFNINVTLASPVGCPPASVARVVLIRSGSSTHSFDMNQRYVELRLQSVTGTYPNLSLLVHGPATGYVAPPGYYLLFVIDSNGLPSEGRWVRVLDT